MRGLACLAEASLDAEMVVTVGAWCAPAPTAYLLGLGADFAMARLAVTGDFGHERAGTGHDGDTAEQRLSCVPGVPALAGKARPAHF